MYRLARAALLVWHLLGRWEPKLYPRNAELRHTGYLTSRLEARRAWVQDAPFSDWLRR